MLDIKFIEDIYLHSILRHKGINYFPYLSYHRIIVSLFFYTNYNLQPLTESLCLYVIVLTLGLGLGLTSYFIIEVQYLSRFFQIL